MIPQLNIWLCRVAATAALLVTATGARALDVPSGQAVELQEVLVEEMGAETWVRFRFLAPAIARDKAVISYEQTGADMSHLCGALVIPYLAQYALKGDLVIISFADRPMEFGASDPRATQFFEAFRVRDDVCIWEGL